jgi:hypothetical protein
VHGRATASVRSNAGQWWRCPADAGSSAMAVRSCDRTCNARANRTSRVRRPSDPPRSLTVSALSVQGASCSAAGRVVCRTMPPVNPHEDVWKHLLERKGLSSVASVLEEYGLSCEADVSRLDETDLGALSSKLKQLQNNLLRKWVRGLTTGGDCGTILSSTPTPSETPSSSLLASAVSSTVTQTASDKVENTSRGKDKQKESEGEDKGEGEDAEEEEEQEVQEEEEEEDDEEDMHDEEGQGVTVIGEESELDGKDGKRATDEASGAPAAKKSKPSTLSAEEQVFVANFKPVVSKLAVKERKFSVRYVKGKKSTKKQGARVTDVNPGTLAKRPEWATQFQWQTSTA